jgi:dGTPase
LTLEGQICRVADAVAYLNHDLGDAFRAGVIRQEDLPAEIASVLGERHSERINTMVNDIVAASWDATGDKAVRADDHLRINMSPVVGRAMSALRGFMFERVYDPESDGDEGRAASKIMRVLYEHFGDNRDGVPNGWSAVDHIAGMTDLYAIRLAESIEPGIARIFRWKLA